MLAVRAAYIADAIRNAELALSREASDSCADLFDNRLQRSYFPQ
jgi:hypothetical protein